MKYHFIKPSSEGEEVGCYPQVDTYKRDYNPDSPTGLWKLDIRTIPEFDPQPRVVLNQKAKLTNVLSHIMGAGLLVDGKLKAILEKHRLPEHKFYPTEVYWDNQPLEYYLFHYAIEDFWYFLDKQKSKAVIFDDNQNFETIADVDLNLSPMDIGKMQFETLPYHQHLRWEKVVFREEFPKYDFYSTMDIQFHKLASEKLVEAIKSEGITGFTYGNSFPVIIQ